MEHMMAEPRSQELQPTPFFQSRRSNILKIFMRLAYQKDLITGKQLAEEIGVAIQTFMKLAAFLQDNSYIESLMGSYGGYKLTADPKDITLLDMIGFTILAEAEPHGVYEAMVKITGFYDTITLADLIEWDK